MAMPLHAMIAAASPKADVDDITGTRTYQPKWMSLKKAQPLAIERSTARTRLRIF
jgi:hypothetical protein